MGLIRDDKIGVPAQYVNELTGYASLETLYRSLYYSRTYRASTGCPLPMRTAPSATYTQAYPSLLASSGINTLLPAAIMIERRSCRTINERKSPSGARPDGRRFSFGTRAATSNHVLFWARHSRRLCMSLAIFLQAYSKPAKAGRCIDLWQPT